MRVWVLTVNVPFGARSTCGEELVETTVLGVFRTQDEACGEAAEVAGRSLPPAPPAVRGAVSPEDEARHAIGSERHDALEEELDRMDDPEEWSCCALSGVGETLSFSPDPESGTWYMVAPFRLEE